MQGDFLSNRSGYPGLWGRPSQYSPLQGSRKYPVLQTRCSKSGAPDNIGIGRTGMEGFSGANGECENIQVEPCTGREICRSCDDHEVPRGMIGDGVYGSVGKTVNVPSGECR